MGTRKKKCTTPLCDNKAAYPRIGLCVNCYAYLHYWRKKGIAKTLKRRAKLALFQERIDTLTGTERIRRRKAS